MEALGSIRMPWAKLSSGKLRWARPRPHTELRPLLLSNSRWALSRSMWLHGAMGQARSWHVWCSWRGAGWGHRTVWGKQSATLKVPM